MRLSLEMRFLSYPGRAIGARCRAGAGVHHGLVGCEEGQVAPYRTQVGDVVAGGKPPAPGVGAASIGDRAGR